MPNNQIIPLTRAADRALISPPPCAVCRRRFRPGGRQIFTNCTCLQYGPRYTALFCALGVAVATAALLALTPKRADG